MKIGTQEGVHFVKYRKFRRLRQNVSVPCFGSELEFDWELMGLVLMKSNNGRSVLKGHEMKGMRSSPIEQK